MNQLNRVIKFQNYDMKKSITSFWCIILLVNALIYAASIFFNYKIEIGPLIRNEESISIVAANIGVIAIYFIVNWIVIYYENFALALSFGVTRKNFYKSIIINNIVVALISSIIQGTLQLFEKNLIQYLNFNPLVDFGIFNTETDNIFFIFLALFIFFSSLISITNLIGILQFKFGYKFWVGFGITFIITQIFKNSVWDRGLSILFSRSLIFLTLISILIICYIVGYLLITESSVKK